MNTCYNDLYEWDPNVCRRAETGVIVDIQKSSLREGMSR